MFLAIIVLPKPLRPTRRPDGQVVSFSPYAFLPHTGQFETIHAIFVGAGVRDELFTAVEIALRIQPNIRTSGGTTVAADYAPDDRRKRLVT